ncbi:MAG TPA: hypothetical protein VNZ52_13335 [Candidatus Thermoplasmatota archaeon]|nr:hypothetical protein [Candidatus Thermoplasmatota archaeon]
MSNRASLTLIVSALFATTAFAGLAAAEAPQATLAVSDPGLGPDATAAAQKCYGQQPRTCVDGAARCQITQEWVGFAGTDTVSYCIDRDGPCYVSREYSTWWGDSGSTCFVGTGANAEAAGIPVPPVPLPCGVRTYGTGVGAGCWIGTGTIFWVSAGVTDKTPWCYLTIGWDRVLACSLEDVTCGDLCYAIASAPCTAGSTGTGVYAGCAGLVGVGVGDGFAGPYCYATVGMKHLECSLGDVDCGKACRNCITDGTCDPCFSCYGPPMQTAQRPGDCMQVYREYDFGIVRIVSRDSCHADVYVNGHNVKDLLA